MSTGRNHERRLRINASNITKFSSSGKITRSKESEQLGRRQSHWKYLIRRDYNTGNDIGDYELIKAGEFANPRIYV